MELVKDFESLISIKKRQFDNRFALAFNLDQKRFENDELLKNFKQDGLQFSKEALSNLMAGIGYYYGSI
jgi:Glycosyl hydrolase family 63 C-terminal domain